MTQPLRIAVADDEPDMREYYEMVLPRLGHTVVAAAASGSELVALCRAAQPGLIITDLRMPDMDGVTAGAVLQRERPVPVIVVSAHHQPPLGGSAETDHVMTYLAKPVRQNDLSQAIDAALLRFNQFQTVCR